MRPVSRILVAIFVAGIVLLAAAAAWRIMRVNRAAAAIPVYPGAHEGGGQTRYFPRFLSWDDRSSARVRRIFALSGAPALSTIARNVQPTLAASGWYLVAPDELDRIRDPQIIVWQRDPDERLDLSVLWPLPGMTRDQRLYGGIFPAKFLDAPLVIEWTWALGGPRASVLPRPQLELRVPPPPEPRSR